MTESTNILNFIGILRLMGHFRIDIIILRIYWKIGWHKNILPNTVKGYYGELILYTVKPALVTTSIKQ
jgi:hypothetical protein